MKHIVSFSGGKDSTAMLLMMLEKKMQIDNIVFCDTGMEFPEMYNHIKKVEKYINQPITILKPEKDWNYWMFEHIKVKGKKKGEKGYGFPLPHFKWCTQTFKRSLFNKYLNEKYGRNNWIKYIGFAFDEYKRIIKHNNYKNEKLPLVQWKITEGMALKYCYDKGFDWIGLYTKFDRVSCWCCPFQKIKELNNLYHFYPDLWKKLKEMEKRSRNTFKYKTTLDKLEQKFELKENYSV